MAMNQKFVDITGNLYLNQHFHELTRLTNALNILLSTYPACVTETYVIPGMSDHHAVTAEVNLGIKTVKETKENLPIKTGDSTGLKTTLRNSCDLLIVGYDRRSLNDNWTLLKEEIMKAVQQHIPTRNQKNKA